MLPDSDPCLASGSLPRNEISSPRNRTGDWRGPPSFALLLLWTCLASPPIFGEDCNNNGKDDAEDLLPAELGYRKPEPLLTGVVPTALIGADLNGDGALDLVAARETTEEIFTITNVGGDRFSTAVTLAAQVAARTIAAADLDGDGWLDLALTRHEPGCVIVLPSDGAGGFRQPIVLTADGKRCAAAAAGDLDGDGDADLAVASVGDSGEGWVTTFVQTAFGFVRTQSFPTERDHPAAIAEADLDGDQAPDLATANHGHGPAGHGDISVFLHASDGSYRAGEGLESFPIVAGLPTSISAARVGTDRDLDLIITSESALTVLLNDGRGRFPTLFPWQLGGPVFAAAADLHDDGRRALAVAHWEAPECGAARGEVQRILVNEDGSAGGSVVARFRSQPRGIVAADFDSDGDTDLVVGGTSPDGVFLLERGPAPRSEDCNANGVPDECDVGLEDCNGNGFPDDCDLAGGHSPDCNANGFPDECERDCDRNGIADDCDLAAGVAGDCNADGIPDACELAANDRDASGVPDDCEIAIGKGPDCNANGRIDAADLIPEPRFTAATELAIASWVGPPLAADMDGDGALDLLGLRDVDPLCVERQSSMAVLFNRGGGAFVEGSRLVVGAPARLLAAADLDADGDVDVLCATAPFNSRSRRLLLLRNRGNGQLDRGDSLTVGSQPEELEAGDLDGDGRTDLVVRDREDYGLRTFWNDGRGGFAPRPDLFPTDRVLLFSTCDMDSDGSLDIVTVQPASTIEVRRNMGSWNFRVTQALSLPPRPLRLLASDIDGDGGMDLGIPAGYFVDGGYAPPVVFWNDGHGRLLDAQSFDTVGPWHTAFLADLDGDRALDMILSRSAPAEMGVSYQQAPRRFEAPRSIIGPSTAAPLLAADFLKGGRPQVLFWEEGKAAVLRQAPAGGFEGPNAVDGLPFAVDLAAGDFDGDEHVDVALASEFALQIVRNDGAGALSPGPSLPLWYRPAWVRAWDLSGDGATDLVSASVLHESGIGDSVSVFLNTGNGGFAPARNFALQPFATSLAAGDLNGDNLPDLVAAFDGSKFVSILFNSGGGQLAPETLVTSSTGIWEAEAADLDGDQGVDLAGTTAFTPQQADSPWTTGVALQWNRGDGTFEAGPVVLRSSFGASSPRVADVNADGNLDIVVTRVYGGYISVAAGLGGGEFAAPVNWLVGGNPEKVLTLDLDLDGDVDFATELRDAGRIVLLLNAGVGRPMSTVKLWSGVDLWRLVAADLNDDGRPDLVGLGSSASLVWLANLTQATSLDVDADGRPDECGGAGDAKFRRGDANADARVDISDALTVLRFLFAAGAPPPCVDAADMDDDGRMAITDSIVLLDHLFRGEGSLPPPGEVCGPDPTLDGLDCAAFEPCR